MGLYLVLDEKATEMISFLWFLSEYLGTVGIIWLIVRRNAK